MPQPASARSDGLGRLMPLTGWAQSRSRGDMRRGPYNLRGILQLMDQKDTPEGHRQGPFVKVSLLAVASLVSACGASDSGHAGSEASGAGGAPGSGTDAGSNTGWNAGANEGGPSGSGGTTSSDGSMAPDGATGADGSASASDGPSGSSGSGGGTSPSTLPDDVAEAAGTPFVAAIPSPVPCSPPTTALSSEPYAYPTSRRRTSASWQRAAPRTSPLLSDNLISPGVLPHERMLPQSSRQIALRPPHPIRARSTRPLRLRRPS